MPGRREIIANFSSCTRKLPTWVVI